MGPKYFKLIYDNLRYSENSYQDLLGFLYSYVLLFHFTSSYALAQKPSPPTHYIERECTLTRFHFIGQSNNQASSQSKTVVPIYRWITSAPINKICMPFIFSETPLLRSLNGSMHRRINGSNPFNPYL